MAGDSKGGGPGLGGGGAILVALLATGIWFARPAAIVTTRPAPLETRVDARFDDQDVEARLWQDPFEAIGKQVEKADAGPQKECAASTQASPEKKRGAPGVVKKRHCHSPLVGETGELVRDPSHLAVLGVVAPSAPYFEDSEFRRRLRYAVLAGLHLEGYEPTDDQHIGYFRPDDYEAEGLPVALPYEVLQKADERLLLTWIDEGVFRGSKVERAGGATLRLLQLKEIICPQSKCRDQVKFSLLGPYSSDARKKFSNSAQLLCFPDPGPHAARRIAAPAPPRTVNFDFYSYSATAQSARQGSELTPPDVCPKGQGPILVETKFFDTIASDDMLAAAMVRELGLRNFPLSPIASRAERMPHVAILSDRDTAYGQGIVKAFENEFDRAACAAGQCARAADRLHFKSYLRGLDGMTPARRETAKKQGAKDDKKNASDDSTVGDDAFGQSQSDYLRRIANELLMEDAAQRRKSGVGIDAIGVLGNDVFDKLMVLRALQPLFPSALFFTTDYDGALVTASELQWSRNLIVASNYGPLLAPEQQGEMAPFRSVYQTSAFLASRLASREIGGNPDRNYRSEICAATREIQVLEVERSGEFLRLPARAAPDAETLPDDCRPLQHGQIQPRPTALYPLMPPGGPYGAAVLLSLVGAAILYLRRKDALWPYLRTTWVGLAFICFLSAFVALDWDQIASWATEGGFGEPIVFSEGVSAWSTVAIRAIVAILAFTLTIDAWMNLQRNLKRDVWEKTLFPKNGDLPAGRSTGDTAGDKAEAAVSAASSAAGDAKKKGEDRSRHIIRVLPYWKQYRRDSSLRSVALRVGAYVGVMCLVQVALYSLFGWPHVPWRGHNWIVYDIVTTFAFLQMLVLTFLVADATILCLRFVIILRDNKTLWPDATRRYYKRQLGIDDDLLDDWIDLVFIAARTKCIGGLIYMPFSVAVLLIVSRSSIFADFAPSVPIAITMAIAFGILFACAMGLSFAAEQARSIAKDKISRRIQQAKALQAGGAPSEGQLAGLLALVEDLHEGAFVPLSQQPPIRALLLPLSGLGWTALVDSRLFPGL